MKRSLERLKHLSNAFGVSGDETEVRNLLKQYVEPLSDSVNQDPLGNLIAIVKGSSTDAPSLLLAAHTDEIGLMVTNIQKEGFLQFTTVGGWDTRILLAQPVVLRTSTGKALDGIIGSKPPHIQTMEERKKVIPIEELFIDIGVSDREEAENLGVRVGDRIVVSQNFQILESTPKIMRGRTFDDRIGCAVLVEVLEQLKERGPPNGSIYAGFSVQEEVGGRGAYPLAYNVNPSCALALEGTVAAKTPGTKKGTAPSALGKGPAITIMDRSLLADSRIVRKLEDLAKAHAIPFQFKRPPSGGTDAGRIHTARGGIPSGVLSVPCRYIHSPNQLAHIDDFLSTIRLVVEFCYSFHELF
ncbi:MAG: M42 family metallopeptidase [Candidatus Heimdallarchaeota archaeon]